MTTAAASRAEETANPPVPVAESAFEEQILPFLETHCFACHGETDAEGGIALESYQEAADIERDSDVWETVVRVVSERQMPPAEEFQPSDAEIVAFVAAVRAELASLDCAEDSLPGRVTVREVNRPEYNNTIHDLVGIDFQRVRAGHRQVVRGFARGSARNRAAHAGRAALRRRSGRSAPA